MLIWRFANTIFYKNRYQSFLRLTQNDRLRNHNISQSNQASRKSHLVLRRFVILWSSLCLSDSTKHPWAFTTSLIFLRWQLTKLAIYLPPFWKELKSYWPLWYCLFMLQPSVKKGSLPRGCFQYRHATLLKRESRSKHCIWQKMHFKTITQARNAVWVNMGL